MNTTTKNKIQVKWLKGIFTIAQLQKQNPNVVPITLRFKINQAIEAGEIVSIGKNPSKMGRPTLVFAPSDVTTETLLKAKNQGIILDTAYETQTTGTKVVASFNKDTTPTKTTPPTPEVYVDEDVAVTETVTAQV